MNKFSRIFLGTAVAVMATTGAMAQKATAYGKKFSAKNAKTPKELVGDLAEKPQVENVVLTGKISQVCQAEGCWMKVENPGGEDIFVKFKDHSFLIPKDLAGHKTIVYGTAMKKVVSVEERRHMAEDAGASAETIAAINEPKSEYRIEATGITVQ
jgi:hypothetical protein